MEINKLKQEFEIDFVVPWVDGSDLEWIKEFNKYAPKDKQSSIDINEERFRDYGLLKYFFRGIEKFAPWVHKVYFITNGQKPEWLNEDTPKLKWIKHSDYMPKDALPVFSSHPIELCMNKIPGLSEHFVYFNDDFYLTAPVGKDFFFKNGIPCDSAIQNAYSYQNIIGIIQQNVNIINKYFSKRKVIRKNISKWYNFKYGSFLIRNICLSPWPIFTFFFDTHIAQAYVKKILDEVWEKEKEKLSETVHSRFRNDRDVNQWLFRYWTLCKGDFYPVRPRKNAKVFFLDDDITTICDSISKQKYKEIVLNEKSAGTYSKEDFDIWMTKIEAAFNSILPEKSSFEK